MTSDPRIDRLEGEVRQMSERFSSLENAVDSLRSEVNTRLNSLENRTTAMWVTTIGTMLAGSVTLFVAIILTS